MTETHAEDLAAWLTAVWDEEEARVREALAPDWTGAKTFYDTEGAQQDSWGVWLFHIHPTKVLARIAADRKILADYKRLLFDDPFRRTDYFRGQRDALEYVVKHKAEQYADRPGFRSEWLVERQGVEQA